MKLLSMNKNGKQVLGVKTGAVVVDMEAAQAAHPASSAKLPTTVMEAIAGGKQGLQALQNYIAALPVDGDQAYLVEESKIDWGSCVTHPQKIICVGLNYRKHAEETGASIPEYPILFNKFANTLTAHKKDIAVPGVTEKMDYEAELCIVIGQKTKNVPKDKALDHVFGYCNVNDLSARDLQTRTSQWLLGKSCDDFSPVGPYLVTADEIENPNNLAIKAIVNGEVRQNSNTSDMIFHCDEIISYISRHMTLEPGDLILTGTPEGVVLGYPPEKQVYLKPGDRVTIEIEHLGSLTNHFVAES